jgi:hypothetical protein
VGADEAKPAKNIVEKFSELRAAMTNPREIPFGLSRRLREGSVRGGTLTGGSIVAKAMIMAKLSHYRAFSGE